MLIHSDKSNADEESQTQSHCLSQTLIKVIPVKAPVGDLYTFFGAALYASNFHNRPAY